MMGKGRRRCRPHRPTVYYIRVRGQLDESWSDWFDGLDVAVDEDETLLSGPVADQAALHGLLKKVRAGQFDNDTVFQGAHHHRDSLGRVVRMCLSLGVVPVFTPPRETGFQAMIENFNGRWQAKVWSRFEHRSLRGLKTRSASYIATARSRAATRIESAPPRLPFPKRWRLNLQKYPQGKIIYLRRTNDKGRISLLGHTFQVDRHWLHRLVRTEVDLDTNQLRIFALRRREPTDQPLLREIPYTLPSKRFKD